MRAKIRSRGWNRLLTLRRLQHAATPVIVTLGPVLALATFFVLGPLDQDASSPALRYVLLADLVYVLVVAAMVLQRVAQMIAARRARSAGSRLHLRLTGAFALIALIPTVLVAVFAMMTVNAGLEGWFSDRVRQVVGTSLAAAEAYKAEHREDLIEDTRALAGLLTQARRQALFLEDGDLRQILPQGQSMVQRGLREAYIIDATGTIRARGDRSYLFDFEQPSEADMLAAGAGEVIIIEDWDINEFRGLMKIPGFADRYLYVSRDVDGAILSLLDDTQETVRLYNQLESDRGRLLFEFGLLYLGFAVLLILAAIWLGLWFAERLARPVGRLTGAVQRVGAGDFDARVIEEQGDDEIAMLGRIFNQMTRQLKTQHETLVEHSEQIDRRRRLFDSVLGSVTAGVVGLDAQGQVAFVNRSAERMLGLGPDGGQMVSLAVAVPEFGDLFARLRAGQSEVAQEEIRVLRGGKQEILLVRMATRRAADGTREGYVVVFDDVTDLVSAQRMAAWGDVARRIAHEIKNPLTPIQLSAERIKRKFSRRLDDEDAASLEQYTDVIVRQTGDLRRIVDEFSRFARMPEPDRRPEDMVALVRGAVLLQQSAQPGVDILAQLTDAPVMAHVDATMIGQALTNLIKNAGEAIDMLSEAGAPKGHVPRISVTLDQQGEELRIVICDNGIGLPEDRSRLFEPYVTTREKGTGLGLPIVKKIIEEHGGSLTLGDAEPLDGSGQIGARAEIRLQAVADVKQQPKKLAV
ncbi:MAG: PAS domain-containing sensor histidine kinase [Paracoccaceae bacterium]